VDLGVVFPSDSLEQHGSGVAVAVPAGVVRAGVTARGVVCGGQAAVGADQRLGKSVGSAVDVISLDSDDLGGSRLEAVNAWVIDACSSTRPEGGKDALCSHVEFHESLDLSSSGLVAGSNGLRAKEPSFLTGIEVDLYWGCWFEVRGDQGAEDLYDIDGTGTILTRRDDVSVIVIKYDLETKRTSSAPGARPVVGAPALIESSWAPRIVTGPEVVPSILAITEN